MIIDQLPLLSGDLQSTDEIPIERGTTTYKTTVDKITVPTDATPTQGSTNPVQSGGVYDALQTLQSDVDSKQAAITANGILKGNGTSVSAATKGTDYGSDAIQITLTAAGWASNEQTISNAFFASGFVFLAEPVQASKADYGSAGVYADDVTTSGQLTFHCTTSPSSDLTVNIVRIVSASGKTINIAGGGSSGGSEWELLWTNPNPNTAFDAQTISIDLSQYEQIMIDFNANTDSTDTIYVRGYCAKSYPRALFCSYWGGKYTQRTTPRGGITDSGIQFGTGQISGSYGATPTTANQYLVPVRIYAK